MQFAQPKPRPIDERWGERLPLAIRVLGGIQNDWLHLPTEFPSEQAAAVVLRIFAFNFRAAGLRGASRSISQSAGDLWRRTSAEWISSVSDLESECCALCPAADPVARAEVMASLRLILTRAAESWARHSPVTPSCEDVVNEVLQLLVSHRFVQL